MNLTKKQLYAVIAGVAVVVIALASAGFLLGRGGVKAADSAGGGEAPNTVEATWTVESTASATTTEGAGAVEQPPAQQTQPSYTKYARVKAVSGIGDNRYATLDFFDIFTGQEANAYAKSHGVAVPSNGILYADEDSVTQNVPLSTTVEIVYKTGGVESLQEKTATPEQLAEWAAGNLEALPGAMSDQWEITVKYGIVTRIEMVAIAD